ncbi:DUF1800 domain-containing protein [Roseomonas stagni]|uniref:DUF1800 domain-containing protein n=1 Tax=Falsiroseomonas algicola TaxID=2716930 RepID=A0A6M1LE70_9PROT|nr:DUF1800 domain-containing protein [Falsiroseomonas algicola]NGM18598.1 DUF1800 domain-containing protein [Falsiroseomonas algicola]
MSVRGHIAAIRFGYGLRLGEAPPANPEAWLIEQLDRPAAPPEGLSLAEGIRLRMEDQAARRAGQETPRAANGRSALNDAVRNEGIAHAHRRLTTAQGFRERLVDFWMNHFTVSRRVGVIQPIIGAFERDAIRPHVTGRFADMVVAVARHPAMLVYLDNAGSIGPNSPTGQRRRRGLNENLAREVLELHTLSPAGGYTQEDVQAFARLLTGWSVEFTNPPVGFVYRTAAHEPGAKVILGRRFGDGEAEGEAALRFLAEHPATWRHLAVKLARHFVADDPPPAAVRALEAVLRETKGDLGATARALVRLPQAWDPPLAKFRAPADYVIAAARAIALPEDRADVIVSGMAALAQPLWTAPQPNGWPDTMAEWASPEGLMRRVDWAYNLAGRAPRADARAVAETALGPLGKGETATAMARAGSVRDALTLLFGSPEFMQR